MGAKKMKKFFPVILVLMITIFTSSVFAGTLIIRTVSKTTHRPVEVAWWIEGLNWEEYSTKGGITIFRNITSPYYNGKPCHRLYCAKIINGKRGGYSEWGPTPIIGERDVVRITVYFN